MSGCNRCSLDGEHAFAVAGRAEEARDTAEIREAAAAIHLAEGEPELALDVLAPVVEGGTPMIHRPSAITEALALNAAACERLGDRRVADASLERALELAEPEKSSSRSSSRRYMRCSTGYRATGPRMPRC